MTIGLDTNVLVRWLVNDGVNRKQAERAAAIMAADALHLSTVAMAETVWVLSQVYRFPRSDVASVVRRLLGLPNLQVECAAPARIALDALEEHGGDFNDHLIAAHDRAAGCRHTVTFDRKAARSKHFSLLKV